jgi:DNA-binding transcriptional LysR family regulator
MKKIISGTIRISTIPSIGLHVLPPYLKKFQHDYPSVNMNVVYRRTNLVYEDILNNSVDFGLVAFPAKSPQIEMIPFLNDHFVLITHPSHPLARGGDVQLSTLAGEKFIGLDPGGPAHQVTDQIFRKYKIDPMMKFDNFETVKEAVEINAGIAIVPQFTVLQEVKQGSLVAIQFKGRQYIRPLAILHRKGRVLMRAMEKFVKTLGTDLRGELKI